MRRHTRCSPRAVREELHGTLAVRKTVRNEVARALDEHIDPDPRAEGRNGRGLAAAGVGLARRARDPR